MKTFTLPIASTYVSDWGVWEGVRELLQNGIDREREASCSPLSVLYDREEKILRIRNEATSLDTSTLVLGNSSKGANSLGKFGEGYKIAFLALLREGKTILVQQKGETWSPFFRYHEDYKTEVLNLRIIEKMLNEDALEFLISGITEEEFEEIEKKFLQDIEENISLKDRPGDIFVCGLFVTHLIDFKYGYNFGLGKIPLNRDRNMSCEFDIRKAAALINSDEMDGSELLTALEQQKPDVSYLPYALPYRAYPADVKTNPNYADDKLVKLILAWHKEHPETVPVSDEAEIRKLEKGTRFKIVPQSLRDLLHRTGDFINSFMEHETPAQRLEKVREQLAKLNIPSDILEELDNIVKDLEA